MERGKEVWARRVGEGVGQWGWGKGPRGWNLYLNKVLNKTGIVTLSLVIGMHITRLNRPKIVILGGFLNFGRESPCNDITFSKISHNLTEKNLKNENARDFTGMGLCNVNKKEEVGHLGNLKICPLQNFKVIF